MLMLSRKRGQRILVDGGIVIEVVDLNSRVVRLGITAPQRTKIMREELAARDGEDPRPGDDGRHT